MPFPFHRGGAKTKMFLLFACGRTLKWKEEWIAGLLIPEWGHAVCVLCAPEYLRYVQVHMQVGAKGRRQVSSVVTLCSLQ